MKHKPTVYAVHWPEINVFKIGYSETKRWRAFENRGANVLHLMEFDSCTEGYDFEWACHREVSKVCRPGFASSAPAVKYLGGQGGGYMECYRVPGDLMPWEILHFVDSVLDAQASSEHMPEHYAAEQSTNGRTDELTQNYSPKSSVSPKQRAQGG